MNSELQGMDAVVANLIEITALAWGHVPRGGEDCLAFANVPMGETYHLGDEKKFHHGQQVDCPYCEVRAKDKDKLF